MATHHSAVSALQWLRHGVARPMARQWRAMTAVHVRVQVMYQHKPVHVWQPAVRTLHSRCIAACDTPPTTASTTTTTATTSTATSATSSSSNNNTNKRPTATDTTNNHAPTSAPTTAAATATTVATPTAVVEATTIVEGSDSSDPIDVAAGSLGVNGNLATASGETDMLGFAAAAAPWRFGAHAPQPREGDMPRDPGSFAVNSYFITKRLDITALRAELPASWEFRAGKESALLMKHAPTPAPAAGAATGEGVQEEQGAGGTNSHVGSFVSVHTKGALVFVNCDWDTLKEVFTIVRRTANVRQPEGMGEELGVKISPDADKWSEMAGEQLVLRGLDLDSVLIVASVMAQTVILDYYEREVDTMLDLVQRLNAAIENDNASALQSDVLYKHLTRSNDISIHVIMSGLNNQHRPGSSAWKEEKYFKMNETLWDMYELESRYDQLDAKVSYINEVIKYCLEVQKENKFLRLERMIVYLIMAELAVSLMDGHVFAAVKALLQYLGVLSP